MRIAKPGALALVLLSVLAVGCAPAVETADADESASTSVKSERGADEPAPPGSGQRHYTAKPTVDPIKANGPIFVDWPKPDLAIMISGELDG
ncbi:MAG TPA: hypothetical protein VF175_11875, partial [Lacipirellula sp.]